jgi:hypothetical protein
MGFTKTYTRGAIMNMSYLKLFVAVVFAAVLPGCATTLMTEQQIKMETSPVLGVPVNEMFILQKHPSFDKLIYTVKVKSGFEYICNIYSSDIGPDKKLINPPTCIKMDKQVAQAPTFQNERLFPKSSQKINHLITKTKGEYLNQQIERATPFILDFIPRVACLPDSYLTNMNFLPRYTTDVSSNGNFTAPVIGMKYHDKYRCITVAKIYDWKSIAKNAISFSVLYIAEDSNESRVQYMQLVEQPDGIWLAQF